MVIKYIDCYVFLLNTASKQSAEYFPNKNIGAKLF